MTQLSALKGIGEKNAALYEKLGISTVESALFYFPRDYIEYESIISSERFSCDTVLAFEATVLKRPLVKKVRSLYITSAVLVADGIKVTATWFHMPYLTQSLKSGSSYVFRGKLSYEGDHYHIEQPVIFTRDQYEELCGHINPVYSLTKGLTNNAVTKTVRKAFDYLEGSYDKELFDIHFPKDEETLNRARKKLVFDEFLTFLLNLKLAKGENDSAKNDFNIIEVAQCERIIENLPYRLTNAQIRVWEKIREDLCKNTSMSRLIQGDVGSGKTILATLAAVMVCINGYQSAIMAPTEILASQHFDYVSRIVKEADLPIKTVLLTGSMSQQAKKNVRAMIASKEAGIVIGTHALIQDTVEFKNLALVVTDEQHRFGVSQRARLSSKGKGVSPHVLVMSATPIPRTLALILYADLNVSVIDEVPAHKKPIKNAVVDERFRKKTYEHIKKEIDAGHQAYVICPLIEESEGLDAKNVNDTAKEMSAYFDENVKIGILHGKMKAAQKQKVMDEFAKGYLHILVSTTVVEVGVNVPNATVMVIENADRFGLAALHQLRGRIGRGPAQSYCIFMNSSDNPQTEKRLDILKNSNDGFVIAEEDLKMRGPGDMFGMRQSGDLRFKLADIYNDSSIIKEAAQAADDILADDPDLSSSKNQYLRKKLIDAGYSFDVGKTL